MTSRTLHDREVLHTHRKDSTMRYSGGRTARRTSVRIATGALVTGGLLLVSPPGAQAHPVDVTFTRTGAASWTVPEGVTSVSVLVSGAQGGGSNSGFLNYGSGGLGAHVSGSLTVSPGEQLSLTVGGTPTTGRTGGIGGGGGGGDMPHAGAGGGGASTIAVGSVTWVVAGGGGGAAYGVGGGASGQAGHATGQTQDGLAGGAGTLLAGGAGGSGGSTNTIDMALCTGTAIQGPSGAAGAAGAGGLGGGRTDTVASTGGGGGGGGYFGGGGGGGGAYCTTEGPDSFGVAGGGGGGSSYVLTAVASEHRVNEGVQAGDGSITITYADSVAPVGAPVQTPAPNAAGWNNTPVTVAWNWTDAVSGVDPGQCVQTSGTGTRTGAVLLESSCRDLAGNTSSASVTVKVDTAAPAAVPVVGTTLVNGWSAQPVDVTWAWSDALSGIDPTHCPASSSESREGVRQLAATCTDLAGNSARAFETVRIDRTAPAIKIRRPIQGTYHRGRVVLAKYRCRDAGAGVASCRGSVANGKPIATRKLGKHTFVVTAVDRVGHTRSVRLTYRVVR